MTAPFRILFIGDISGDPTVLLLENFLPAFLRENSVDFCIANGENAAGGRGIAENQAEKLFQAGVNVITGGDHSFDRQQDFTFMRQEKRLLRPLNYPKAVPGSGYGIFDSAKGIKVGVLNLRGQAFFQNPIDCPFRNGDWAIGKIREETPLIWVDFHAEATAEKKAMGWYLDGRVSAVVGTHTHVQTADEEILPQGTAYLTDAGFTGPHQSVIGMEIRQAINRMTLQIPHKFIMADKNYRLNAVMVDVNPETGKALQIARLNASLEEEA